MVKRDVVLRRIGAAESSVAWRLVARSAGLRSCLEDFALFCWFRLLCFVALLSWRVARLRGSANKRASPAPAALFFCFSTVSRGPVAG